MHPTLFELGGIPVRSYGLLSAIGFLLALLLAIRAARRQGIAIERMLDLAFWILISAMLGSRLLHLITEAPTYYRRCVGTGAPRDLSRVLYDCTAALHLWEGGLVFYGGLLGATGAVLWYCRRHRLAFLQIADLLAPYLALGHFFGRLGCLSAGCCYGKPSGAAWGLVFPSGSVAFDEMKHAHLLAPGATTTPPLHPTQLYEALIELAIAAVLLVIARRRRPRHGRVVLVYAALYSVARFALELFRADPDRRYVVQLTTPALSSWLGLAADAPTMLSVSQTISLIIFSGAVLLAVVSARGAARVQPGAGERL